MNALSPRPNRLPLAGPDATLAAGLGATDPASWRTALIRLVGEARGAEAAVAAARNAYEERRGTPAELHAAEAARDGAYARLRRLKAAPPAAWRVKYGFNVEAEWRAHGLTLPVEPRKGPRVSPAVQRPVSAAGLVGAFVGFRMFLRPMAGIPFAQMGGLALFLGSMVALAAITVVQITDDMAKASELYR